MKLVSFSLILGMIEKDESIFLDDKKGALSGFIEARVIAVC